MASVIKDPGGLKRIQWCIGGNQRRTLRLGNVTLRQADAVRVRIEQVLASRSTGVLDTEAARWVEGLDDEMHKKLSHLGLVKPRDRHVATLGQLLEHFFETLSVKAGTRRTYEQTRASLESHFGASRALESITPLECDQWKQAMRKAKLADATVAKRVKTARQIFKQAMKWKLVSDNPLTDVKGGGSTNRARMRFISRGDIQKVLDACPDAEWRAIVVLSRYGGLRCPSETLALRWQDVDFDKGVLHVRSSKTEHYEGGDQRVVPMFPEIRAALMEAFEHAEEGAEMVVAKQRLVCENFRTQMLRIIKRAGLTAWPKPFHNLRSSRQTELAEEYPIQCVCAWLGNSITVAREHYLQVTDAHLARAIAFVTTGPTLAPAPAGASGGKEGGADGQGAAGANDGQNAGNVVGTVAAPAAAKNAA